MYINKWHITFFETKTGVSSCDIHIAPTPSRHGAQCCASEGQGGRKCPKEPPRVPDSSPRSLANVARWARGVGRGLPRGPAAGVQAVLQSRARAEVGHPGSGHSNAKSGCCRCPSQAVDSLGIAPVESHRVPIHGTQRHACTGHMRRALARMHAPTVQPQVWEPGWLLQGNRAPHRCSHTVTRSELI